MESRISRPQSACRRQEPSHESSDVHSGWIFGIVLFLAISGVFIEFIMSGMLKGLKHRPAPSDQWRPTQQVNRFGSSTAFPKLQVSPPVDLQAFRAREDAQLNSYGWINNTSTLVRIPIKRAMDLLLQKGLPVRRSTNEIKLGPSTYELMQQRPLQKSTGGEQQP